MYWIAFFVICAVICTSISFVLQNKQKAGGVSAREKIYITDRVAIDDGLYQFTAKTQNGFINFENKIPFPIGSSLDADIINGQITIYSENVRQNQIFRILSSVEKWRYSGIISLLIAMCIAVLQSDKFASAILGFCAVIVAGIIMFIVVRSKNRYSEYCQEENAGNIIELPYKLITINKNKAYISYFNANKQMAVAVLPKQYISKHAEKILYHLPSQSVSLISKKKIKIINTVFTALGIMCAIGIAVLYVLKYT